MLIGLGLVAAIIGIGILFGGGNKARPTMSDPNVWYHVKPEEAGFYETVGPKGDDNKCHWYRSNKPSDDLQGGIDVGQWDLSKTTGGTQKVRVNADEYFIFWGCYPFHRVE